MLHNILFFRLNADLERENVAQARQVIEQLKARLLKDGRLYRIRRQFQHMQARKAGIDFKVGG
jgi:hypothetical protein